MSTFYERMQATSQRLIGRFKQGDVAYNAPGGEATPFDPAPAGTTYPVDAVQASEQRKNSYIRDGYIVATDIVLVVSPFEVKPSQSGTMTVNGEEYQIVMTDSPTVAPESPLAWFVGLRK